MYNYIRYSIIITWSRLINRLKFLATLLPNLHNTITWYFLMRFINEVSIVDLNRNICGFTLNNFLK